MFRRPIVLTGFMSSGKTTVGKALASRLNVRFADLDDVILAAEGKPSWEIIDEQGEQAFRVIETRVLRETMEQGAAGVVALGGGTWIREENRNLLSNYKPIVVWLDPPYALCWKRILVAEHRRPLAVDEQSTKKLYELRCHQYELADTRISITDDTTVEQIVDQITGALQGER